MRFTDENILVEKDRMWWNVSKGVFELRTCHLRATANYASRGMLFRRQEIRFSRDRLLFSSQNTAHLIKRHRTLLLQCWLFRSDAPTSQTNVLYTNSPSYSAQRRHIACWPNCSLADHGLRDESKRAYSRTFSELNTHACSAMFRITFSMHEEWTFVFY